MQNEKKKKAIEKKIVAVADDILEEGTRTTTFSALFSFLICSRSFSWALERKKKPISFCPTSECSKLQSHSHVLVT